jgi:serine/threonine protein kinase
MANIPKIANLLNTNIISKHPEMSLPNENESIISKTNFAPKLQKLLAQNFSDILPIKSTELKYKSSNRLELLGHGLNGTIYKISHPKQNYICKCINYSPENKDQLDYEIVLITKLQQNEIAIRYINPCLGIAITPQLIITIFPQFNATTIDNIIITIYRPEFNTAQRISLIKYFIYQMILGLSEMHRLGIAHRQINESSILIEVKQFNANFDNGISNMPGLENNNIWYSEDDIPLRVKYTNFGFGCLNTCLPMLSNLDPYQPNGPSDFAGSLKYDVWCLGLLFMKLLHQPSSKKLVGPELEKFLDVVQNHMLVPLESRKSADYIKDTFAINDKLYDDFGSDGTNETQKLVDRVLAKIV